MTTKPTWEAGESRQTYLARKRAWEAKHGPALTDPAEVVAAIDPPTTPAGEWVHTGGGMYEHTETGERRRGKP